MGGRGLTEEDAADLPDDAMVLLAALISRTEALVVSSMLGAAGILVSTGGIHHASVEVNSLALGGHRLWVPARQHTEASEILLEVLGDDEWSFSKGLQRAVLKFLGFYTAVWLGVIALASAGTGVSASYLLWAPLSALAVRVNPQGRGDYFLADDARDPV